MLFQSRTISIFTDHEPRVIDCRALGDAVVRELDCNRTISVVARQSEQHLIKTSGRFVKIKQKKGQKLADHTNRMVLPSGHFSIATSGYVLGGKEKQCY